MVKRYEMVEEYKENQLGVLQAELDQQLADRLSKGFEDVDAYKEKQMGIIQKEVDLQVEARYSEVDAYKKGQLETLQLELDQQVEKRYKEADQYKEAQVEKLKSDLKAKFNISAPSAPIVTTDNVVKFLFEKEADEDTVFKAKLAVFNKSEVKNHKDRDLKMKIRKAKTIPELFAAYNECLI